MLACAIGDCNIDVFIRVVEATGLQLEQYIVQ